MLDLFRFILDLFRYILDPCDYILDLFEFILDIFEDILDILDHFGYIFGAFEGIVTLGTIFEHFNFVVLPDGLIFIDLRLSFPGFFRGNLFHGEVIFIH